MIIPEETVDEEGGTTYERVFATEVNIHTLYEDIGKVHQIFDEIMVPAATVFFNEHWNELADKNVDTVVIRYNVENGVFVSIGPVYGTVAVQEPSSPLEIVDTISVNLPVSWWYYAGQNPDHWLDYGLQLPNASARISFLSYHMQDILDRHKVDIVSKIIIDDEGVEMGKVLGDFSAVMLQDMARISTSYVDDGYAYVQHTITEYLTDTNLVLPLPPSAGSLYSPIEHTVNKPVILVKSAGKPLSVLASLSLIGTVRDAIVTYPDGTEILLKPYRLSSEKAKEETLAYNSVEYLHNIPASAPSGIYQLVVNALTTSTSTGFKVFVTNGYLPPDLGTWRTAMLVIDEGMYPVRYNIGPYGEVANVFADLSARAVMVRINSASDDDRLIVELPRSVVDSLFDDGADKAFLVTLSDFDIPSSGAKEVENDEILANDEVRVVGIDLEEGTDLVQIRGTQIVPEFGIVGGIVLAVSITLTIMVAKRNRTG